MPAINDLFRRVRNHPQYIKSNGEISSAIYLDSKGVSVDIDAERNLDDIISAEEEMHLFYNRDEIENDPEGRYKLMAITSVSNDACIEKRVLVELDPVENINPYHAVLKRSKDKIELTGSQRKYLKRATKVVKSYDKNIVKETE